MTVGTIPAIEQSVRVAVSPERAFRLWTEELAAWWPLERHGVFGDQAETVAFEGGPGGRVVERSQAGEETTWAEVTEWEPPSRFVLSWHPGHGPDDPPTELEVRFLPDGDGTLVELEHRGWEQLGDRGESSRNSYDGGWRFVLQTFADRA
jgi:uncharacterized protein YndB with AHSA1/START domain